VGPTLQSNCLDIPNTRRLVIKQETRTLGTRLEFIPTGMTGQVRLPDRRILGSVNRRPRPGFGDENTRNVDAVCMTEGSAEMLLNVWNHFTQHAGLGAWDHIYRSDATCH
jgi:hypothetical protein